MKRQIPPDLPFFSQNKKEYFLTSTTVWQLRLPPQGPRKLVMQMLQQDMAFLICFL
jgi:hypothetical protein